MSSVVSAITGSGAKKAAKAQARGTQLSIEAQRQVAETSIFYQRDFLEQQLKVFEDALAQEKEMFDQAISYGEPYRQAGETALQTYQDLTYGTEQDKLAELIKTPGYQFRLEEGQKAIDRMASAKSGMFSGRQLKAAQRYGQDYATSEYGNFMDRVGVLMQQGAQSAQQAGALTQGSSTMQQGILSQKASAIGQTGANISNINQQVGRDIAAGYSQMGAARAQGYLQEMAQANQLLNNAAFIYGMSDQRLKENFEYIGDENGHRVYKFNYKGTPAKYIGVIAQEVQKKNPEAVTMINGHLAVNYKQIGVTFRRV